MERQSDDAREITRTNERVSRGSRLARFVNRIGDLLGLNVSQAHTGASLDARSEAGETSRSVEKAVERGDARGRRARKAKAKKTAATKPAARKIAHRRGAKMASAAKADTADPAKAAARANPTAKASRRKTAAPGARGKRSAKKRP